MLVPRPRPCEAAPAWGAKPAEIAFAWGCSERTGPPGGVAPPFTPTPSGRRFGRFRVKVDHATGRLGAWIIAARMRTERTLPEGKGFSGFS